MKLKLNKYSVTQLSRYLEKQLLESGCTDVPTDSNFAYWIALFARDQMELEAKIMFNEITSDDQGREMIRIIVEGPKKSGKGYVISAITKCLEDYGMDVTVQLAESHNAAKLEKTRDQIEEILEGRQVQIMETQTSK